MTDVDTVARLLGERKATATRLRAIAESLTTQEPRRDCAASLLRLAQELETELVAIPGVIEKLRP